jgi:hypothetical protein
VRRYLTSDSVWFRASLTRWRRPFESQCNLQCVLSPRLVAQARIRDGCDEHVDNLRRKSFKHLDYEASSKEEAARIRARIARRMRQQEVTIDWSSHSEGLLPHASPGMTTAPFLSGESVRGVEKYTRAEY